MSATFAHAGRHRRPARRLWRGLAALCCATALLACSAKPPPAPPPVVVTLSVRAGPDCNPDASGRASPVVVRVYQMRSDAAFRNLDLDALYARDKELLAADLVQRDEWTLRPGDSHDERWTVAADVHAVGVIAALRDYRAVPWRTTIVVPPASAKTPPLQPFVVEIGRDGVRLLGDRPKSGN